jgi:hypothetical protein
LDICKIAVAQHNITFKRLYRFQVYQKLQNI